MQINLKKFIPKNIPKKCFYWRSWR